MKKKVDVLYLLGTAHICGATIMQYSKKLHARITFPKAGKVGFKFVWQKITKVSINS